MPLLTEADVADVAVIAYLDGEDWKVHELPDVEYRALSELESELRHFPDDASAFAMLSLYDDFAIIARLDDDDELVVVLSDITAALDWHLARSVTDHLGLVVDEAVEDQVPAGDLRILTDLGIDAVDLGDLLADPELYPDDLMAEIADRLGFGELLEEYLDEDED